MSSKIIISIIIVLISIGILFMINNASNITDTAPNATDTSNTTITSSQDNESSNELGYGLVEIVIRGSKAECPCWVHVEFAYPGAPTEYVTEKIEGLPHVIRVNVSKEISIMEAELKEIYKITGGEGSKILPGLNIRIYDSNGYYTHIIYSSLDYYKERAEELKDKGLTPEEASLQDPFKPFKEGFTIVIDLDKVNMTKIPS